MARHYGTAITPARPARPRDKAKVEVGVQVVQRWVLARLRNRTFSSLAEINAAIAPLREELNARVMKTFGKSRQTLFNEIERAALAPLPERAFECAEWKMAKVNIDYHVEYDHHFYSVPYTLLHERVEVRATATMVEILHRHVRVASHARSRAPGR
jgi:transposase